MNYSGSYICEVLLNKISGRQMVPCQNAPKCWLDIKIVLFLFVV